MSPTRLLMSHKAAFNRSLVVLYNSADDASL